MLPCDQSGGYQAAVSASLAARLQKDECSGGEGSWPKAEGVHFRVGVSELKLGSGKEK